LWKQYEKYEEEKNDDKKKKPVASAARVNTPPLNDGSVELSQQSIGDVSNDGGEEEKSSEEVIPVKDKDKDKNQSNNENADTPYSYDSSDLLNMYDEYREYVTRNSKPGKKNFCDGKTINKMVFNQNSEIYDPEFLNRLLIILYKCSCNMNEKILINLVNPLHFSHLIKLLRVCSTENKFLIAKILANVCPQIPEEILIESVDLFMQTNDYDPFMMNFSEKKKKLPHGEKIVFVELIFSIIEDIKKNVWTKDIESTGCHIVVHELIMILQRLWNVEAWNSILNGILEENLRLNLKENLLRKEILLSILGGEYVGQSIGSQVSIRADSINQGVNFDFIKKDFNDHFNYGTIVGFSNNIEDFWLKKSGKEKDGTKKKNDKPSVMYLTPNNNLENNVGVLLNDSLLKDEFNLNDVNPRTLLQHQIKVVQREINFKNFNIKNENIKILLDFLLKNKECSDSETINFKTNIIRFLEKYFSQKTGFDALFSMEKELIKEVLMEIINIAGSQIKTNTNYLNLDLLEEKRYRLMNLATENNFSLGEIQKASICYRKPNMIIFRLSSDTLLNICYPILGVCNGPNLMNFTDYMALRTENENEVKDSVKIYVCNPENVLNAINLGKRLIITYSLDIKSLDSKYKKQAETTNTSIVSIDVNHFKELICLYESIVINNNKLEDSPLKNSFLDGSYKDMVEELELFGFPKEHITKELAKMKDNYDLNTLINNLMELKEKNKEEEINVEKEESKMVTEEVKNDMEVDAGIDNNNVEQKKVVKEVKISETEKNEEEDEFEIEPKNECFNCIDSDTKAVIPEYFEEMVIGENEDYNVIYRNFKTYNQRIIVFYARRIILNVLNRIYLDEENSDIYTEIIQKIPTELFVNILKLLTHEGLFLNSINWGSEILLKIKNLLTKIYSSTHPHCLEISEYLIQNTKTCLEEIIKSKSSNYEFIIRNEEILIQKPMVFFSVWNLMIVNDIPNIRKFDYTFVLNVLAGLILKIKENKQLRWFILELLVQLINRITNNIKTDSNFVSQISEEMSFRDLENLTKLRKYLDESISRESKKNLSKRSQMICELLIFIEDLENKFKSIVSRNDNNKLNYLLNSDQKKDNFVSDLLLTFEMLKDFFDKKYLRYLAWTEINPEIVNSSKFVFESSHLYSKAPHTSLIHIPNTTALEITISNDTLLDNGDTLIFSLDKNCVHPVECYANRYSKKSFQINSSHTFTHFPANYITEIYTFGSNTFSRLGHSGNDVFSPKLVDSLSSCIVKDIAVGETFLFVLTHQGELLACGNGLAAGLKQLTSSFTKASNIQKPDKISCEGIGMVGVYNNSTIVMSQDFNLYSIGTNQYGQLGQGWTNPVNEITSMGFTKRLKQICVAESHALFLTIDNQVYSVGSNDYYQNGDVSTARSNNPRICVFDKGLSCEMISCGEYFSIFLMKDKLTGKTKLYSAGDIKNGKTGQGKEEICHALKIINTSENENQEWKFITSSRCSSAAITTTGKVFVWGSNSRGQLALGHYNNVTEPTLVTFFEKYTVEQVAMSSEHTLFLVKDSNGKLSVFSCGDSSNGKLGETVTQKTEKKDSCPTPLKISFFEGKYPTNVYAGPRASVVLCKPPSFETLRDIHQYECSLCNKNPIIGNLSIEITDEIPKFYCNDCSKIAELSDPVPRIILKAPVKEQSYLNQFVSKVKEHLTDDNLEETVNVNCKNCKNVCNNDNRWFYTFQENKVKSYFCTECFDIFPSCITGVKVYLKSQKLYKNLEEMNASNLYELSISYGYKFSITPVLNEKGCDTVIEKHQNSYNNFVEDLNDYNKFDVYEQYVDLLNNIAQKAERSIFTYSPKELSFKKEDLSVRGSIEKCSSELLRKMFVILKILNNRTKDLLPFIDFSKVLSDNQRLSFYFNKITPLIFWDTKNEIIKYYFEKTASDFEVTELKINRMKARKFIDKGKPDHTGEFTVFGQMFQFLKQKSFRIFKKKEGGNNNKMFNVTFVGEASIDAGGPYREALSQICTEMQSACLPLFIPSPNQKNESGLFREKWIVNPSAKSITHLEMFKYIGGLIGYAMRTGEFMNLDLPSIFWKQLLEAPIERKDLEYIDRYTIQCLDDIINIHKKGVTQDTFSFYVDQKFTTCLSDGSEVELVTEGKTKEVT
jgi:alpha-tubulin suppressor-like RCC1 family protein